MKYRSEIDGLRAIAVIPVILFHAGFSTFSGGFVGVDVFFVISGYLISTIILTEMDEGKFTLVNFYERRARRILPALFLIILVSLPFAWFWLFPSDLKDFSESLVAVSTFSSNILFWYQAGYWDAASEMKPLLHTWSLAVEDQFYVLFPLFLMFMWRFRKRWIFGSFMFIAGLSLLAAQWGAYHQPTATFYLLPTRAWELAIGAGIAFYFLYRKQTIRTLLSHKLIDEIMGFIGLFLIIFAIFVFDKKTPFPSFYALVPTMGAGLIILFASNETIAGRLLSSKPLVGIGLISYSAYLWHQPLFVFARHRSLAEPSELVYIVLSLLSIALAFLSWRYVEQPFRNKGVFSRKVIFLFSVGGSIFLIVFGLVGYLTNGFENRAVNKIPSQIIDRKLAFNHGLNVACDTGEFTLDPLCRTDGDPDILVWGDSFAMHLVKGIMASNPNAKIIQLTKFTCGPFFDIAPIHEPKYPPSWAQGCLDFSRSVHEWLNKQTTIKYAVLASPYYNYLLKDGKILTRDGDIFPGSDGSVLLDKAFENTINELRQMGITPVVFSPPPLNGDDIGRCLAKSIWQGGDLEDCDFSVNEVPEGFTEVRRILKKVEKYNPVIFLDDFICRDAICTTHHDNTFLYRDEAHLSCEGSTVLGKKFKFYDLIVNQ